MPLVLGIPLAYWAIGALGSIGLVEYYRPGGTKDRLVEALSQPSTPSFDDPVMMSQNANQQASQALSQGTAVGACSTCFPPECRNIVEKMRSKSSDLMKELRKYNPAQDALGGHTFMAGGVLKTTRPGGHYQEIRDLQRGLKNELETYNRSQCYDKNPSNGDKAMRNQAQDLSSRNIEVPPGINYIPL
jgi:hypothetical protein